MIGSCYLYVNCSWHRTWYMIGSLGGVRICLHYTVADVLLHMMKPVWWLKELCSIGILLHVLLVNVCTCRGTRVGFETAKGLPYVAFLGCFMQFIGWLSMGVNSLKS